MGEGNNYTGNVTKEYPDHAQIFPTDGSELFIIFKAKDPGGIKRITLGLRENSAYMRIARHPIIIGTGFTVTPKTTTFQPSQSEDYGIMTEPRPALLAGPWCPRAT
jgi:hypothetical protein